MCDYVTMGISIYTKVPFAIFFAFIGPKTNYLIVKNLEFYNVFKALWIMCADDFAMA